MAAEVRSLRLKVSSNHELVSACLDRGGARDFAGYIRHFVKQGDGYTVWNALTRSLTQQVCHFLEH